MLERSGSCALVALIVGETCYIANVGDSRAVLSSGSGTRILALSRDHKPNDQEELKRIRQAGGKVYQSQYGGARYGIKGHISAGPFRVYPGKLSVSRTFGDIEAKLPKYGGNPGCVIAVPDIKILQISNDADFIVLASDGVFDALSNHEALNAIWNSFKNYELEEDLHKQTAIGADAIIQESIDKGTSDNVTTLVIAFGNLRRKLFPKKLPSNENKENKRRVPSSPTTAEQLIVPFENVSSKTKKAIFIPNERKSMVLSERLSTEKVQPIILTVDERVPEQKLQDTSQTKKTITLEKIENKAPNNIGKSVTPTPSKNQQMESLAQTIARKKLAASKPGSMNTIAENENTTVLISKPPNLRIFK